MLLEMVFRISKRSTILIIIMNNNAISSNKQWKISPLNG